jgi:hypothetical protein
VQISALFGVFKVEFWSVIGVFFNMLVLLYLGDDVCATPCA